MNDTRQWEPAGSMTDPVCCGTTQSQSQRGRGLRLGDARARLDDAVRGVRAQFGELQGTTMHRAREAIRSADETVLNKSMVTVIGPTPPGTGVMGEALSATPA